MQRNRRILSLVLWRTWGLSTATIIGLLPGCAQKTLLLPYQRALAPTMDRMVSAYEDLASKRFQVLADFETPPQETLFELEPAGGSGSVGISTERARTETGVGSLKMSLMSSSQQVVASDSPDSKWALYRDWSKYHLLIFNVYSPRKLGGFKFSIHSGTDLPLAYEHHRILLKQGWNLVRVDLGDLTDFIDLADVRQIRFWCEPLDTPTDLYLDDLILVDNARDVFASVDGESGDLYVRTQGRRLVVGAIDRFELVFSQGRIRKWFDLSHDPGRTQNLVGIGFLGPTPVVDPSDVGATVVLDDVNQWSKLGITAEVHQSLAEATPLRAVVQGEWRFGSPETPVSEASPYHRWVYSIYRDGRIFTECSGTARATGFEPPGLGIVFCCDGDMGFERKLVEGRPTADRPEIGRESYLLFNRSEPGQADLLIVPFIPLSARVLKNPKDSRLPVLWSLPVEGETFIFTAMLRVWPTDIDSPAQAEPLAIDYCHPLPINVDAGSLVRTDPGDYDNDGFSESQGYYVLQLDGNIAKVRIDGRRYLRFSPIFKLVGVQDRDVWVYQDGRQIKEIYRNQLDQVLFTLPEVISRETLLEVTSRVKQSTGP